MKRKAEAVSLVAAAVIASGVVRSFVERDTFAWFLLVGFELTAALLGATIIVAWLVSLERRVNDVERENLAQATQLKVIEEAATSARIELELVALTREQMLRLDR